MTTRDEILQTRQERINEVHRLQPGRTALLVIDMQRGFLEPGAALEVPAGRAIIPNVQKLVEACRQRRVPVIFSAAGVAGGLLRDLAPQVRTAADH